VFEFIGSINCGCIFTYGGKSIVSSAMVIARTNIQKLITAEGKMRHPTEEGHVSEMDANEFIAHWRTCPAHLLTLLGS
jgi:hypothetical protein